MSEFTAPSMLDLNLEDVAELKILPDNTEVQLSIRRAELVPQKKNPGRFNLALVFDCPEDPLVDDIRVWIPYPDQAMQADDPKAYAKSVSRFREFLQAFGARMPLQVEALQGLTGWAIISEEAGLQGTPQNSVRRFLSYKR